MLSSTFDPQEKKQGKEMVGSSMGTMEVGL